MSVLQTKLMQECPRSLPESGQGLPLFSDFSNYSMFMAVFEKSQEYFLEASRRPFAVTNPFVEFGKY